MDAVSRIITTLFFFYYNDLFKRGMFEAIEHKFMVRGHSYFENDRDFALIEKRKKSSTLKSSMLFPPVDWGAVIEGANLRNPFNVTKVKQKDFKSYKTHLERKYYLQKKDTVETLCDFSRSIDSTLAGDQSLNLRQGNRSWRSTPTTYRSRLVMTQPPPPPNNGKK